MINLSPYSNIDIEPCYSRDGVVLTQFRPTSKTFNEFNLKGESGISVSEKISNPKYSTFFKINYQHSQTNTFNQQSQSIKESDLFLSCRNQFKQMAYAEELEYGITAPTEILLKEFQKKFSNSFGAIIQDIYLKNVHDSTVMISLLKGISGFEYASIYPMGQTAALAAVSNKDEQVREAGIRAFENWEHPDGISILESVHSPLQWLDKYRISTINFLKSL